MSNPRLFILTVLFQLTVPPDAINVSTSIEGVAIAGQRYVIYCTVTKQSTLSVMPEISWLDPNGVEIYGQLNVTSTANTTVSSSSLEFDPLLTSQNGVYLCQVSLISATLSLPLNSTAAATITVQSMIAHLVSI